MGLSVDYSIHIGFKYSTLQGSERQRVIDTMTTMGPPVMHGALSTLIAVLILATAETYIFQVFFKMFILVGTLGGAHGLIVLPCMLYLSALFYGEEKSDESTVEVEVQATES